MIYPYDNVLHDEELDKHRFIAYQFDYPNSKDKFLEYIIPIIKDTYGLGIDLDSKIKNMDPRKAKNLKKFMKRTKTPDPSIIRGPKALKVTRNEITEVIGRDILVKNDDVTFPFKQLKEKEDADMPSLGIDGMGFVFSSDSDGKKLDNVVLAEIKTSGQNKQPPDVVHQKDDSLFNALMDLTDLNRRFEKGIARAIEKMDDEEFLELLATIAQTIEEKDNIDTIKEKIIVTPILLRNKHWGIEDFGKFKTHYHEFNCSHIKFYLITLDYDLVDFADEIYTSLRDDDDV